MVAGLLLLLGLFIVLMKLFYLNPLKLNLQQQQQNLTLEQKMVTNLGKKSSRSIGTQSENTTELQKQLPVKPLQDQLILDLEKAETVSNSQIKTMSFTSGAQAEAADTQTTGNGTAANGQTTGTSSSQQANQSTNTATSQQANQSTNITSGQQTSGSTNTASSQQSGQSVNSSAGQQTGQTATNSTSQQTGTSAATGIRKLTVQLNVESPSYEDFEKFVETLEALKRIVTVEVIQYTGSNEITSFNQSTQPFTFSLTGSAYYMPGLTELLSQLPTTDTPEPANKANPLNRFPEIPNP